MPVDDASGCPRLPAGLEQQAAGRFVGVGYALGGPGAGDDDDQEEEEDGDRGPASTGKEVRGLRAGRVHPPRQGQEAEHRACSGLAVSLLMQRVEVEVGIRRLGLGSGKLIITGTKAEVPSP